MWLDFFSLDIIPTGPFAELVLRLEGKEGHLSVFCSEQIVVLLLNWDKD